MSVPGWEKSRVRRREIKVEWRLQGTAVDVSDRRQTKRGEGEGREREGVGFEAYFAILCTTGDVFPFFVNA